MNVREATPSDTDAVLALFEAMDWDRPWPRPQLGPSPWDHGPFGAGSSRNRATVGASAGAKPIA